MFPPLAAPSATVIAAVVAMALLSSSLGYLLYFRLLANIGPVKTLTVTFLSPVFGIGWGAVFLGEAITTPMLLGAVVAAVTAAVCVRFLVHWLTRHGLAVFAWYRLGLAAVRLAVG